MKVAPCSLHFLSVAESLSFRLGEDDTCYTREDLELCASLQLSGILSFGYLAAYVA